MCVRWRGLFAGRIERASFMEFSKATIIAQTKAPSGVSVDPECAKETECGWYFPYRFDEFPAAGSKGLIVDKVSGRAYMLGSAFSLERDLAAFDQGFRFGAAHLIVSEVRDLNGAIGELLSLRVSEVIPEFAHGVERRIAKPLTSKIIEARLGLLPTGFGPISVYFAVEPLQGMQVSGNMRFELQYE